MYHYLGFAPWITLATQKVSPQTHPPRAKLNFPKMGVLPSFAASMLTPNRQETILFPKLSTLNEGAGGVGKVKFRTGVAGRLSILSYFFFFS